MKRIHTNNRLKNYTAVFAFFMIFSFGAFMILSPIIKSHADTTTIGTEVNAVISLTTSEDNLRLELTPTSAGATASDSVSVSVDTNSLYGYELYLSSVDNNTAMTSTSSESTITSNFETTTLANLPVNSWGYSVNGTDFSSIPTLASQARIKNIEHLPGSGEASTTVHFGTKVSTSLPSGFYSKDVILSAVTIAPPTPAPTMQTFDKTTLTNVGDSITLEDERDGNMYTVKKLADGNVWMVEDLKLGGDNPITLRSSNSDVSSNWQLPAKIETLSETDFSVDDISNVYIDDTYGAFYTFYAATAGTGGTGLTSGEAPSSICPKGWRLPTGGSTGEFNALYTEYNSGSLMQGDPGFEISGFILNGSPRSQDYRSGYWSSTIANANKTYYLYLASSRVGPMDMDSKYIGYSVRCIAR